MTTLQWTDEIVRLGACDSGVAWAQRRDFPPTADQIERGMSDSDCSVRRAWAQRRDFTPTPDHVARGMRDDDWLVRRAWALRRAQNAPRIGEIDE